MLGAGSCIHNPDFSVKKEENSFLLLSAEVPQISCKRSDGIAWFEAQRIGMFYQ